MTISAITIMDTVFTQVLNKKYLKTDSAHCKWPNYPYQDLPADLLKVIRLLNRASGDLNQFSNQNGR